MGTTNRRGFLKSVAVGGTAAGAGLAATGLFPRRIYSQGASKFNRVRYRELGSTGCKVTEMGFGVMNNREADLVHAAIDSGINYIDTAHYYMKGENEKIVGSVMKTKRDKVFLTTKVGLRDKTPESIRKEIDLSLKRLQTDRVDLLLFHKSDKREEILNDDTMKVFDDARKKGQTRFVGFSTHNFEPEPFDAGIDSKFWEAILTGYNYFSPPSLTKSIQKTREAGIAIIGMKNLITMTWPPDTRVPYEDIRKDKSTKTTPQQALLKWVLDDNYVDTIIPGMTTFEHLNDNLAVMGMKLTLDDRRIIRRYCEGVKSTYCRGVAGCTECREKCPKGVKVCDINRCLGYAYGYKDLDLAYENYQALPKSNRVDICADCDECAVKCVNGLNLTENIRKARELFA
ncbi:MAG: aldo/keto reductase [Candidatus Latescibacteria bacterium]|nr:aldo/keto reductase [Candidatus Latescibacterota bacterium]